MTTASPSGLWTDAVRLAVGTLTIVRLRPPSRIDSRVAGRAMALAPVVGLLLGVSAGLVLIAGRELFSEPRLAAALTIAWLALMTRGRHLEGLANTADGLMSVARGRDAALLVMRQPTMTAVGAMTLTLVLLIQVLALGAAVLHGYGTLAIMIGCLVGRLAAAASCARGIPAARDDGLGAILAGSVSRTTAVGLALVVFALAALGGGLVDDDAGLHTGLLAVAAVVIGLVFGGVVLLRCVRRLGGITSDVLGAVVELATLGTLLTLAT